MVEVLEVEKREQLLSEVMQHISDIYHKESEYHPLRENKMRLSFKARALGVESGIRTAFEPFSHFFIYLAKLHFISLLGGFLMHFKMVTAETSWGEYKKSFVENTDYRKYDGTLRMVISGNRSQRQALQNILETYREKAQLVYGIHASDTALVTCMITDYNHDHVHLLDGSNGGYTMASKQLKEQLLAINMV